MDNLSRNDLPNNTAKFFYKISMLSFYTGQPNFWIQELSIPKRIAIPYSLCSRIITVVIYVFILSEWAAFFTQKNMTEKQESNQMVFVMAHSILWSYSVSFCRKINNVRKIMSDILDLKQVYNDAETEKQMMKKSILYSSAFVASVGIIMSMYLMDAIIRAVMQDDTITTVITAWPMVDDTSVSANFFRLLSNVVWWIMVSRVVSVYTFAFTFTCCMSHQFINLQSYFHSLNDIFTDNRLSQQQKESNYEAAYKIGIKLHSDTLECVSKYKSICRWLFDGQIIYNITMLILLMQQLLNAVMFQAGAIGISIIATLMATGLFMCNAGDVTIEASHLCTAMYSSGWENCQRHSSVRVRKLVITSMVYAQRPVLIKGLGVMDLSYESYVSLVKSTYSLVSLICQQAP